MPHQPGSTPPHRPLSLHERHYRLLENLIGQPLPDLRSGVVYRLRAEGFMDLVVEVLSHGRGTGARVLSLAHYFEQAGDLCQNPEMAARVSRRGRGILDGSRPSPSRRRSRPSTSACTRSPGWWFLG